MNYTRISLKSRSFIISKKEVHDLKLFKVQNEINEEVKNELLYIETLAPIATTGILVPNSQFENNNTNNNDNNNYYY